MINLFHPDTCKSTQPPDIGGKGLNLLRLQNAGHPVPEWVAFPASAFIEFLKSSDIGGKIETKLKSLTDSNMGKTAAAVQKIILQAPLPEWLQGQLESLPFLAGEAAYVAVRSSAADEDGILHSFAGIHESFLYIRGASEVAEHVRKVWASGYHERALQYRRLNKLTLHPVPMAVILQRMVEATRSGVVFTADPAAQNPFNMVISAVYGLGEGLVGAGLPADHIVFEKNSGNFHSDTAAKETQFVLDKASGQGLVEIPVPEDMRETPALTDEQIRSLARTASHIEKNRRRPQDIEFCFDDKGRLYILQTRDITTVSNFGPAAGNRQIWDNSNIIESYSGPTSPMTFSFIRHAYTVVYHCFSQVMGIPESTVRANRHVFENMIGLINGQVYYNLMNWYRLIQQFPGYAMNKRFMESMMGLRERFDPEDDTSAQPDFTTKYFVELPRLLRLVFRMIRQFNRLDSRVQQFQDRFNKLYTHWESLDFDDCAPHELMAIYNEMEEKLLWNWQAPIINDFYVMIFYGMLKKTSKNWCGDHEESLQNDLICGNGDIESTEPTRMLMRLAMRIRQDPEMKSLFEKLDPTQLAKQVTARPECKEIHKEISLYLKLYGFRCINELKLEEPSLRETPEFVFQVLKNYLDIDEKLLDAEAMEARELQIRASAEKKAYDALSARTLGFIRRPIFKKILRNARKGVRNRENMRFARTRIYGVLRELINAMGRHLLQAGRLDNASDIFYLTIDELWDFVKGTAVCTDLRAMAAVRKKESDSYRSPECPVIDDHFETFGMVYSKNTFKEPSTPPQGDTGDLRGIGCCPGTVTAPVRIVKTPKDNLNLNGCILVAARTDPGWVPLYPAVAGILIERGSILSHSAIVAREMGIPTIVGIKGLLNALSDGQTVTMDGQSGTLNITIAPNKAKSNNVEV